MKEGWTHKKLGEVCNIGIGRTPSRSDMSLWDKNKQTQNYWVSIADMGATDSGYITKVSHLFGVAPEGISALGGAPVARKVFKDFQYYLYKIQNA